MKDKIQLVPTKHEVVTGDDRGQFKGSEPQGARKPSIPGSLGYEMQMPPGDDPKRRPNRDKPAKPVPPPPLPPKPPAPAPRPPRPEPGPAPMPGGDDPGGARSGRG